MTSDLDINDAVLAQLRSAADIIEVIGEHTRLKKAGRSWKGLCPFHNERTPSFTVDREKGLYHCFGCGAGGDVIHFVRQIDRLDFPEAVEALASRFGVSIPKRPSRRPGGDRREKLLEAIAAAQRFFAAELSKPANPAARYLEERGVPAEVWKKLGMGYAPDSWDSLGRSLSGAFPEALLVEAGLLQPRPEGRGAYDRFRHRLLFVLRDERGRAVGFGGRALAAGQDPKYLNSPESPIFQKKRTLYGFFEARDPIRRRERAVLVEGYFDHLALLRAGVEETVASMGTALTPEQAERLRRHADHVILCYDGDAAGRAATRTAIGLCLAQGLRVSVVRLPEGEDPDDVLGRAGPAVLASLVEEAPDFLQWLLEEIHPDQQGISASERSSRVTGLLEIVKTIPEPILRYEQYRKVSQAVGIPIDVLWRGQNLSRIPKLQRNDQQGTSGNSAVLSISPAERRVLRVLLQGGDLKLLISKSLREEWLSNEGVRKLVRLLRQKESDSETVDFPARIAHLKEQGDLSLLSLVALEEGPEPTRESVQQALDGLETSYLRRESGALLTAIGRAESEKRSKTEIDGLLRQKQEVDRRIKQLKPSRKGNELGD
ncbi:MAG TPA: DNA primase [Thermoanaerobaculia bacterium]|nr:DNA primase [Thermoanaerobaculia bacterium]